MANKKSLPVPWPLVKSRFHCSSFRAASPFPLIFMLSPAIWVRWLTIHAIFSRDIHVSWKSWLNIINLWNLFLKKAWSMKYSNWISRCENSVLRLKFHIWVSRNLDFWIYRNQIISQIISPEHTPSIGVYTPVQNL